MKELLRWTFWAIVSALPIFLYAMVFYLIG